MRYRTVLFLAYAWLFCTGAVVLVAQYIEFGGPEARIMKFIQHDDKWSRSFHASEAKHNFAAVFGVGAPVWIGVVAYGRIFRHRIKA